MAMSTASMHDAISSISFFHKAARRDGRRAEPDARSLKRRARFEGHGVLVARDVGEIERLLRLLRGELGQLRPQIDHEKVIVGAAATICSRAK